MEKAIQPEKKIRAVIVDDSIKYRAVLRVILSSNPLIEIIGEAVNGIEALEVIWELKPDVIVMECEMPIMDGMTALQHLMIHIPTPTILFSRLTQGRSVRGFDALKNGAVDFIGNDILAEIGGSTVLTREFTKRIINASCLQVQSVEPVFPVIASRKKQKKRTKILVFCEECGAKTEMEMRENEDQGEVVCTECQEFIPVHDRHRYRRANFLSIIVGGEGAYSNLIKLVPQLPQDINGAIIIIIKDNKKNIDDFTEYLNSTSTVNIVRVQEGIQLQGGSCYIASISETIVFRPFSAQYTFHFAEDGADPCALFTKSITSFVQIFKKRVTLSLISGAGKKAYDEVQNVERNGLKVFALDKKRCLEHSLEYDINTHAAIEIAANEEILAEKISDLHTQFRDTVVTA